MKTFEIAWWDFYAIVDRPTVFKSLMLFQHAKIAFGSKPQHFISRLGVFLSLLLYFRFHYYYRDWTYLKMNASLLRFRSKISHRIFFNNDNRFWDVVQKRSYLEVLCDFRQKLLHRCYWPWFGYQRSYEPSWESNTLILFPGDPQVASHWLALNEAA